ncbi:MAG: carbonic anhydrase, partial [Planctomycetota bacterium]|nr:carbonic anhydrase [Planctomycetota bacterium]
MTTIARDCAYRLGCAVLAAALGLILGAPAQAASDAAEILPDEALARLKNGNARFADGQPRNPHRNAARRDETVRQGQRPMATVIACSDSRVPVEILLDQGIGDIFAVRVAGNVCNTDEIGSAEYGVDHLGTPLLVVMGHSLCGAVTAVATNAALHGHIAALVEPIK